MQRLRVVPAFPPLLVCLLGTGLSLASPEPAGALPPGGDLSGRALDAAGRVVAGVQVMAARRGQPEGSPFRALTDSEGRFHLRGLPQAEYVLVAARAGYLAGVSQVGRLPATGVLLVLGLDHPRMEDDMTWVLRLPGRDLLRTLQAGMGNPAAGVVRDPVPLSTHVEQRFGVSMGSGIPGSAGGSPDVGTRLALTGETPAGVAWRSGARFEDLALGRAGTGQWRQTEDLFLSGGADLALGDGGWLSSDARLRRERLTLASRAGLAENRAAGVDLEARLPGDAARIRFQARAISAAPERLEASEGEPLTRRTFGLSLWRAADVGVDHRLIASLSLREHQAAGGDGQVLLGRGADGPGEAYWLVPGTSWAALSLHDRAVVAPGVAVRYGLEVRQPRGGNLAWIPGLEVDWNPTSRTGLAAGFSYLEGGVHAAAPESPGALSAWFSLSRDLTARTRVSLGASRENLLARDPLASQPDGGLLGHSGVWTDGAALARSLSLTVDQLLGRVQGRLALRAGDLRGRVAVPDPFAFTAAPLAPGEARFYGLSAGAALTATGTEVAVAVDRLLAGPEANYTLVGLHLRQRLATSLRAAGEWRLLLDYEGIEGAHPFRDQPESGHVGRVSGGVAVRF